MERKGRSRAARENPHVPYVRVGPLAALPGLAVELGADPGLLAQEVGLDPALLADPEDQQKLYAGTADHGVYASGDGGQSWQPIGPNDLTDGVIESMAWGQAGELFVLTTGGLWRGQMQ